MYDLSPHKVQMPALLFDDFGGRTFYDGERGRTVVKVLRYKSEGRSFDSRSDTGIFH